MFFKLDKVKKSTSSWRHIDTTIIVYNINHFTTLRHHNNHHHHHPMESSPRFRSTDSDTPSPSPPPPTKLRLMCSTGGHILPRPHDKSLCYIGGDTRIISIDRHTTLHDLTHRLSKTLLKSSSFTLKYQLPSEDLDALISVTTDEDLENMIDEYERLNSSSRIRLFVFPTNPDSGSTVSTVSSIGSFLENPSKSEDWFMNALNGTVSGMSDTSSVNCLLDLEDEIIVEKKDVGNKRNVFTNVVNNSGQDVYSVPDSGQETTSSFGSASSHGNLLKKDNEDGGLMGLSAPVVVSGSPVSSATVIREESDPFLLYHERSEPGLEMGYVKHHQQQSAGFDLASMDSILSDLTITDQSSPVSQTQSSSSNNRAANPSETHDQNTRIQMLQQQPQQNVHNPTYLMPIPTPQVESPRHHQIHHQQPQYIPPLQYIHHHPPVAVPVTSYYQHHSHPHPHPHHPPMDQQNFMYYIPTRQPPQGYNFPLQQPQPNHVDTPPAAAIKTESPAGVYRTTSAGAPQLVRVSSGYHNQLQHVGYPEIHQPTQSVYYAAPLSNTHYQKMTSVSPVEAGLQEQQARTAQHSHER